jgi:hypothetical protein
MSKSNKQAAEELGTEVRESFESILTLKPAELEALMARLCACGTRRIKSTRRPRVLARACGSAECGHRQRIRAQWCRLGERGRTTIRLVDTKFG